MPKYFKIEGPFTRNRKITLEEAQTNEMIDTFNGCIKISDEAYKVWDDNLNEFKKVVFVDGYTLDICDRTHQKRPIIGMLVKTSNRYYLTFTKFSNHKNMPPIKFKLYQKNQDKVSLNFNGYWEDLNDTNKKSGFCGMRISSLTTETEQKIAKEEIFNALENLFEYFPDRMKNYANQLISKNSEITKNSIVTIF